MYGLKIKKISLLFLIILITTNSLQNSNLKIIKAENTNFEENFYLIYVYKYDSLTINGTFYDISIIHSLINSSIEEKGLSGWNDVTSLKLDYSFLSGSIYNCNVFFRFNETTFNGSLLFDRNTGEYYHSSNPNDKIFVPFILSTVFLNDKTTPFASYEKTESNQLINSYIDIKKSDTRSIFGNVNEFYDKINYYVLYSELKEKNSNYIYNYESSYNVLLKGILPWLCLSLFLEMSNSYTTSIETGPFLYLYDTNIPFSIERQDRYNFNNNSLLSIFSIMLMIGVPIFLTLFYKIKKNKQKLLLKKEKRKKRVKR